MVAVEQKLLLRKTGRDTPFYLVQTALSEGTPNNGPLDGIDLKDKGPEHEIGRLREALLTRRGVLTPAAALAMVEEGQYKLSDAPRQPATTDMQARQIDLVGMATQILYAKASGADILAVGVHSTDFGIHTDREVYKFVIETYADMVRKVNKALRGKEMLLIGGVNGPTEQVIAEAKILRENGFAAALVSPRASRKEANGVLDQEASCDAYYNSLMEVQKIIPVIGFRLQDKVGGFPFTREFLQKLLTTCDNLAGFKNAGFDGYDTNLIMEEIIKSQRHNVVVLSGDDNRYVEAMTAPVVIKVEGKRLGRVSDGSLLGHHTYNIKWARELMDELRKGVFGENASARRKALERVVGTASIETSFCRAIFNPENNFHGCLGGMGYFLSEYLKIFRSGLCWTDTEQMSNGQRGRIDVAAREYRDHTDIDWCLTYFLPNFGPTSPRFGEIFPELAPFVSPLVAA